METQRKYESWKTNPSLFRDYQLTDLMLIEKDGRKVNKKNSYAIMHLLRETLEKYGITVSGLGVAVNELVFRAIWIPEDFPIENEPILHQLYGYNGIDVPIALYSDDDCSISFLYNVDSGKCVLEKSSWGSVKASKNYESLSNMLSDIREKGYENVLSNTTD